MQQGKDPFPADGGDGDVEVDVLVVTVHAALGLVFPHDGQGFSAREREVYMAGRGQGKNAWDSPAGALCVRLCWRFGGGRQWS